MSQMRHVALSVDIDRFSDSKLRKEFCSGWLTVNGRVPTVAELRAACLDARNRGLVVFPPCNNVDHLGYCQGHPEPKEST